MDCDRFLTIDTSFTTSHNILLITEKKDSCPKLPLTSHQVSCHVSKETTLYTCIMTCRLDSYIISTREGTASMTQTQSISCNTVTDTWSHQSTAGDIRWDTCSRESMMLFAKNCQIYQKAFVR